MIALIGCRPTISDVTAFRAWVAGPAHGLVAQAASEATTITCAFRPLDLLAAQDVENASRPLTRAALDSAARSYAGRTYFTFTLAKDGAEIENQYVTTPAVFTAAIQHLNEGLAQEVELQIGTDTLTALSSVYLRQYGTTGHSTVLLVFDVPYARVVARGCALRYRDTFFGLSPLAFSFTASSLQAIPHLQPAD